jgi:hypothetical protein
MIQMTCNFLQLGCDLYSRSTISNGCNPLAVWIELWVPIGRVTNMSFVFVDACAYLRSVIVLFGYVISHLTHLDTRAVSTC